MLCIHGHSVCSVCAYGDVPPASSISRDQLIDLGAQQRYANTKPDYISREASNASESLNPYRRIQANNPDLGERGYGNARHIYEEVGIHNFPQHSVKYGDLRGKMDDLLMKNDKRIGYGEYKSNNENRTQHVDQGVAYGSALYRNYKSDQTGILATDDSIAFQHTTTNRYIPGETMTITGFWYNTQDNRELYAAREEAIRRFGPATCDICGSDHPTFRCVNSRAHTTVNVPRKRK